MRSYDLAVCGAVCTCKVDDVGFALCIAFSGTGRDSALSSSRAGAEIREL